MVIRAGIVGCGLIGNKRARALGETHLTAAADTRFEAARQLAAQHPGCLALDDWRALVGRPDVDLVIVATTNDNLAAVTQAAVTNGKHVLVEKPAARHVEELSPVCEAARAAGVTVKVGFNHRFHPAFLQVRQLFDDGAIGPLMYIRARYGHGGRLGYDREWRADPVRSGGGELLDQGVHLIDLVRWFAGDVTLSASHVGTCYWDMPVEDNAFLLLEAAAGPVAWLHASCTEWKNLFSFEIFGRTGKLQIDGLGGSYGIEKLTWYRMLPELGPPATTSWEYPFEDRSWQLEVSHTLACIREGREPLGNLRDALAALQIVQEAYARRGQPSVRLRAG